MYYNWFNGRTANEGGTLNPNDIIQAIYQNKVMEINHIYNNGLNSDLAQNTDVYLSKDNLKAYYKMEGYRNTLIDSSGNNEDGSIYSKRG